MIKLLDTNICSYILRKQPISAIEKFKIQAPNSLYLSAIVVAELRFGARKLNASRFAAQVEAWIGAFNILPWTADAAEAYAEIRFNLEKQGKPIGNMDLLIAAHSLSLDAVLITNNIGEFERVEGLKLENWV